MKKDINSKRIKESRKPYHKLDFEYWDASDALTERKLYCYDSSDAKDYNFDGLFIYNKVNDRSSQVGCLILTPTSYYLAGPDESTCFEGNSYEEFIKDLDEMMKDIKPAEITEDVGDEDLIAIENDLNETFGSLGIFVEDMGVYRDEMGVIHLSLTLDGDWKHTHAAAKFQLSNSGWDLADSEVLEDRGRDDYCATYDFINVASAQEEVGKRSSPGFITEGKKKVREMARTIKDYNEYKGFTPAQKNNAFHKFVDFLDSINAPWESNKDKQVSGKYWGIEFTLNYAGMGGHAYTIDAMNVVNGTIQDQWVGDSYPDFLEDLSELKNEYGALHSGRYPEDPENLEESRKLKESNSWEKKFKGEIRVRVVGIFRDWVDEDNAQGMVDDFDIDPDNAVEELINEILENEADEIHEGRYDDFLKEVNDDDVSQSDLEEIGEAYLDELEDLDIEEKRRIFGKSHCNKLEKQMQSVSALGDDEDSENEDEDEENVDYEKYWKIEPEAIKHWVERMRDLDHKIPGGLMHWSSMKYKEFEKDDMFCMIDYKTLTINSDGTGDIVFTNSLSGDSKTIATMKDIITSKDIDDALKEYFNKINVEHYYR